MKMYLKDNLYCISLRQFVGEMFLLTWNWNFSSFEITSNYMYIYLHIPYFCSFPSANSGIEFPFIVRVKLATTGCQTKAADTRTTWKQAHSTFNIHSCFYVLVLLLNKNVRIDCIINCINNCCYLNFSLISFFLFSLQTSICSCHRNLTSALIYFFTFIIPDMGLGPHIPQRFHGFSFFRDLRAYEGSSWRMVQVAHPRGRRVL